MTPVPRAGSSTLRAAARFWTASLAGFALHGWVLAASAAGGLAEGGATGVRGEALRAAVALGAVEAVVLGVPIALLFAAAARGGRGRRALCAAVGVGGALAAALAASGWAAVDGGLARGPTLHAVLGAATVAAGAAAAAGARRAPRGSEAREGPRTVAGVAR